MIKLYSYTICYRENTVVAHFCREYSDLIKINKRIKNKYWPVPYTKITNNQTRGQEKTVTLLLSPGGLRGGGFFFKYFWGSWIFMAVRWGQQRKETSRLISRLVEWLFGWKWRFAGWYFDANWKERHFEGYMQ